MEPDQRVQSVIFRRNKYNNKQAVAWLDKHGYIHPKSHVTRNYIRFRQFDPIPDDRYFMKPAANGIFLVIAY